MKPVVDAVEFLMDTNGPIKGANDSQALLRSGLVEIQPLTYIRGRNISKRFVVIDEAQNLTPLEVKTVITRMGQDAKVVLTGDAYQIDNPYVDADSNQVFYRFAALRTDPEFTVVKEDNRVWGYVTEADVLVTVSLVRDGAVIAGNTDMADYNGYFSTELYTPEGDFGVIMEGENRSLEELVRMAGDGILVTRLWYIRNVDWMKSVVTGMTRDGTFRIESGEITEPVKNLRFNEELRRVFKDYTASGTPYRFWDFMSPAIIVPDFNFTSVTDSI